jgi:hypothetical protein
MRLQASVGAIAFRQRGPRPFNYHLNIEILNERTPETWSKHLFADQSANREAKLCAAA